MDNTDDGTAKQGVHAQEFFIDHIVGNSYNKDGFINYCIRWFGYQLSADTDEPVEHLPPSNIVQSHRPGELQMPPNLDRALVG